MISMQEGAPDRRLRVPTLIEAEVPGLRRIEWLADDSAIGLDFSNDHMEYDQPQTPIRDNRRRKIIVSAATGALLYTSHIMDHRNLTAHRGFTVLTGPFHPAPLHKPIPGQTMQPVSGSPAREPPSNAQRSSAEASATNHAAPMEDDAYGRGEMYGKQHGQTQVGGAPSAQATNAAQVALSSHPSQANLRQATRQGPGSPTSGLLLHQEATLVHLTAIQTGPHATVGRLEQKLQSRHGAASAPAASNDLSQAAANSPAAHHQIGSAAQSEILHDTTAASSSATHSAAPGNSSRHYLPSLPHRSMTEVPLVNPNDPHAVANDATPLLDLGCQGQLFPPGGPHCRFTPGQANRERYHPRFEYPAGGPTTSALVAEPGVGGVMVQAHSHLLQLLPGPDLPDAPWTADSAVRLTEGRWFSPSGTLLIRLVSRNKNFSKGCVLLHTTITHGCGTVEVLRMGGMEWRSPSMLGVEACLEWVPHSCEAIYAFVCHSPTMCLVDAIHHQVSLASTALT